VNGQAEGSAVSESGWRSIKDFDAFQELERLSDEVWSHVAAWAPIARDTVGKQSIRAIDSVGANLVEGDGRYHHRDTLQFNYIARGSLKEAAYWLRRAEARELISAEAAADLSRRCETIRRWINKLISQRREWMSQVREEPAPYDASSDAHDT
jgi:four helix bundle protein